MARRRRPAAPGAGAVVVNGRRLSGAHLSALKAAARAQAGGRTADARRLLLQIEAELAGLDDAEWLVGAMEELSALERARGGAVERAPGRIRVAGRDGLLALTRRGAIGEGPYVAGLRYRGWYEAAGETLRSTLDVRPGGRSGQCGADAAMDRLRVARENVRRMEQAVAHAFAASGRPALAADAVMVLREVAGLGRSLRDLASSGARRDALKQRLAEALAAIG